MHKSKIVLFALGPISGAAISFISVPIITWYYSAEDVGRIAMLQVVTSMCVLIFSIGLDQAYVREYFISENKPALFKAVLTPGLILLLVAIVFSLLWPHAMSRLLFGVNDSVISLLIAFCLLASFVSRFLSLILRMQERGLAFSMSQLLPKLLFLQIIGLFILFSFGFDLFHLIIAQTASIVMVTIVYAYNTRRCWVPALGQSIDKHLLKRMLVFGLPLMLGGVASWGLMTMDKLFLRNFSTFEQLGIYSVAANFAAAGLLVQSVFSTIWAPMVYRWVTNGTDPKKVDQVTDHMLVLVVFLFSLTGIFSWLITYLLPAKYYSVQYITMSCIAYPLFYTLSEATGIGLGITRRSILSMAASIIAALSNLIGCWLLVPRYGAAGAGTSTAVAFWVFFICRTEFSIRVWRRIPRFKLYTSTLICLILAVSFTLGGDDLHALFIVLWSIILILASWYFKDKVKTYYYILLESWNTSNLKLNK